MKHPYPSDLLENTLLHKEAELLCEGGFIDEAQLKKIKDSIPALHTQRNILMRAGLGVLGFLMLNAVYGFIGVFADIIGGLEGSWRFLILLSAIIAFFALENVIRSRKYYGYGIDDAFLFSGIIVLMAFTGSLSDFDSLSAIYIVAILAGAFCCYRYIDSFSMLIACAGTTALSIDWCIEASGFFKSFMPFLLMISAGILYFVFVALKKRINNLIWRNCLETLYSYCIVLFYLAGNYMIVRGGGEVFEHEVVEQGSDIPLAWIFYCFTIIVPLFYIYRGLTKSNRTLLQVGVLALAFGVYSIRFYHEVLPIEWGLILAGSLVFLVAYYGINKLKNKTSGITFKPDQINQTNILDTEAFVITETLGARISAADNDDELFSGGSFGGGGSGSNWS